MTESIPAIASHDARHQLAIGVIGAGRFGSALAGALTAAGYSRIQIASRTAEHAEAAATALGVAARSIAALVEESALVFLTVPDREIALLAEQHPWRANQGVVHCSGALGLDVLTAVTSRGAWAGCLHPLQTFAGGALPEECAVLFRGIVCGIEGASPLDGLLIAIAADLGARTVRLEGVNRALYHAAAVLVSNDVVALMAAASRAWALAGLPAIEARGALAPLLLAAASNVARLPLAEALTGPVARGDVTSVERHLEALARDTDLSQVYRVLARELLRLDLGHTPEVQATLETLLRDG